MCLLRAERKGAATCRDGYVPFATALAEADVVSLHCPLTAETQGLIGEPELRAMKPSALLINTARGGLVDRGGPGPCSHRRLDCRRRLRRSVEGAATG